MKEKTVKKFNNFLVGALISAGSFSILTTLIMITSIVFLVFFISIGTCMKTAH